MLDAALAEANLPRILQAAQAVRVGLEARRPALEAENETVRAAVARESEALEACLKDYLRLLDGCDRALHGEVKVFRDGLKAVEKRLDLALERLRSVIFVERGPFTNGGLNQVLQASGSAADFQAAVQAELNRLDILLGAGSQGRAFTAKLLVEDKRFYADWVALLEEAPLQGVPDESWRERALFVGEQFARCDRDYFQRHYQADPTGFPALNLAIQATTRWRQGKLSGPTWRWFVEQALVAFEMVGAHPLAEEIVARLQAEDLAEEIPQLVVLAAQLVETLESGD